MMSLSNIKLDIDSKSYSYAKIYSSLLKDEFQRKRAYASLVALYAFLNLIERTPFNIQKAMTIFRNPILNEKFEISDLYVNNWHLDVRVVVSGNAFLVPKAHIDNNLLPDFYIVVKVDKTLEHVELVGIADTSSLKSEPFDYHYNSVSFSELISYDDFLLKVQKEKKVEFNKDEHEIFIKTYLSVMDGEANQETINNVLRHVFQCSDCRTEFCCFTGFEMVSCNTGKYPDVLEDHTLDIVGAQNLDDEKYKGKEETIYISDDESNTKNINDESDSKNYSKDNPDTNNTSDDTKEETVADILDELFNIEEDYISEPEEKDISQLNVKPIEKISEDLAILPESEVDDTNIVENINDVEREDIHTIDTNVEHDIQTIDNSNEQEIVSIPDNSDNNLLDTQDLTVEEDTQFIEYNDDNEIETITDDDDTLITIDEDNLDSKFNNEQVEQVDIKQEGQVQKVIIDYDETGEPVYSYITPVNDDDSSSDNEISFNDEHQDEINDLNDNNLEKSGNDSSDNEDDREGFSEAAILYDDLLDDEQNIANSDSQKDVNDSNAEDISSDIDEDQNFDNLSNEDGEDLQETSEDIESVDEDSEEEYEEYEDDDDENDTQEKNPKRLIALVFSIFVTLGIIGAGVFFFLKNNSSNVNNNNISQDNNQNIEIPVNQQQNNDIFEQSNENQNNTQPLEISGNNPSNPDNNINNSNNNENNGNTQTAEIGIPPLTENDLIATTNPPKTSDPNKAIVNAFANGGSAYVTVNGVNWNCTAQLFTDKTFKSYLQHLDNLLKQNLKNHILNVTQTPPKDMVAAKLAINNDGNLEKVIISESSGSEQVDNIVLQSINEMFEGEKTPILQDNTLKQDRYYLKVVIKL